MGDGVYHNSTMNRPTLSAAEYDLLRALARRVREIASNPIQDERRTKWRGLNDLTSHEPLIHVRGGVMFEELLEPSLECRDPFFRSIEFRLRQSIYRDSFGDDFVIEPWLPISAIHRLPPGGPWGFAVDRIHGEEPGGSYRPDNPLKELADADRMAVPFHAIDEEATAIQLGAVREVMGDILPLVSDRSPFYRIWNGDISTNLGALRGIERLMFDMMDEPDKLHQILSFMRDGILKAQAEAETAGDWRLCAQDNQSTVYCGALPDPSADPRPAKRSELWTFMAAQELTLVGPAQLEEFMLRYQIPILSRFGLVSYGCCEDLTLKIPLLRAIPNLRRIAVAPSADVRACAEQIGGEYVVSYRPSPADTVCCGFDEPRVRALLRRHIDALREHGCFFEINMKDIQTVEGDPDRMRRFVAVAREELAR